METLATDPTNDNEPTFPRAAILFALGLSRDAELDDVQAEIALLVAAWRSREVSR